MIKLQIKRVIKMYQIQDKVDKINCNMNQFKNYYQLNVNIAGSKSSDVI